MHVMGFTAAFEHLRANTSVSIHFGESASPLDISCKYSVTGKRSEGDIRVESGERVHTLMSQSE